MSLTQSIRVRYGKMTKAARSAEANVDDVAATPDKTKTATKSVGLGKGKKIYLEEIDEAKSENGFQDFNEPRDSQISFTGNNAMPARTAKTEAQIYEELKAAMDAVDTDAF